MTSIFALRAFGVVMAIALVAAGATPIVRLAASIVA